METLENRADKLLKKNFNRTGRRRPPREKLRTMNQKATVQVIWGVLLALAGIGVFFRIPQVMPRIKEFSYLASSIGFIYFCLYLLGVLLVAGGIKKIRENYPAMKKKE